MDDCVVSDQSYMCATDRGFALASASDQVLCASRCAASLPSLLYRAPLQAQQSGEDTGSLFALQGGLFTAIDLDNDLNVELLVP
jgi:hypothetical protein